jgi:hypothetical protein
MRDDELSSKSCRRRGGRDVVEDLAHAVVADRRRGRAAPEVLKGYVHLFALDVSDLDLQLDLERCGVPTAKP